MTTHSRKIEKLCDYIKVFKDNLVRETNWDSDKVAYFDIKTIERYWANDISPTLAIHLITGCTYDGFSDIKK